MSSKVVLATAGYDSTIRFWDPSTAVAYRTISYTDSQINKLAITPDKSFLAAAGNPQIRFFEINTNNSTPVTSFDGHSGNVTSIGFQKDGKWMYTGSEDGTIKIWDLRASGFQQSYDFGSAVNSVVLHPNQGELICGLQNGVVKVWDLVEAKWTREQIPEGEVAIRSVSVSADASRVVAANNKGHCFVWRSGPDDTSVFESLQKIEAHKTYILKALISPDSKLLATASADSTVKIWSLDAPNDSREKEKEGNSKDRVFKYVKTLQGHNRWAWDCAFSANSAYLISSSSDNTSKLWAINSGETLRQYNGHLKSVTSLAFCDY